MRSKGVSLGAIQSWLNAQGVRAWDAGEKDRPYYRAARRWADAGAEVVREFMAADGDELTAQIFRRYLEALDRLERTADGVVPLADDDGWMIPYLICTVGDVGVLRLIADVFPEDAVMLCEGIVAKVEGIRVKFAARWSENPPVLRRAPGCALTTSTRSKRRTRRSSPAASARSKRRTRHSSPAAPAPEDLMHPAGRAVAVARNDRDLYSDLGSYLCGEVLRILTAAEAPIGCDDIAAELQLPLSGEEGRAVVTALHHLKDEGAIIGVPGEGQWGRLLYHVVPP